MEAYFNYISSNYLTIIGMWFVGIPIFLILAAIRTTVYVIFDEEPFGFIDEFICDCKKIKLKEILLFLLFYTIFIFFFIIPKLINFDLIPSIIAAIFLIIYLINRHLILRKKEKITFKDKTQYAVISFFIIILTLKLAIGF